MILLAIAVAAAGAAAALPQRPACDADRVRQAAAPGRFVPLDRLPPANLYLALDHRIDRCPAPIIVRTDAGATQR